MNQDTCVHRYDSSSILTTQRGVRMSKTCSLCSFKDESFTSRGELKLFRVQQMRMSLGGLK